MTPKEFEIALHSLTESRYLERVAAAMNPLADPKDVVQDVLLRLARMNPEDYFHVRDLKRYAAKAVRNRCFELARRRRGKAPLERLGEAGEGQLIEALDASSSLTDPSQLCEEWQIRKLVHQSLDMLSPRERDVARLAHLKGKSDSAIARCLRLSKHVVRGERERAWVKMKIFLTDLMVGDIGGWIDVSSRRLGESGDGCEAVVGWMEIFSADGDLAPSLTSFCRWLEAAPGSGTAAVRE